MIWRARYLLLATFLLIILVDLRRRILLSRGKRRPLVNEEEDGDGDFRVDPRLRAIIEATHGGGGGRNNGTQPGAPNSENNVDYMMENFNWTKCDPQNGRRPLRVFVYPDSPPSGGFPRKLSPVYANILRALRESPHFTGDPSEACLFVLSVDTIDRDRLSEHFVADIKSRVGALPPALWNDGRNHLVFNHFFGSFPDYSVADLGFPLGKAMVAWASAHKTMFRAGFDLAFPLFHADHPLTRTPKNAEKSPDSSNRRPILASFKGKRYVYGRGSEARDLLRHLHNNRSLVVALTCRHNGDDWVRFEDAHCAGDNAHYQDWDYMALMRNSTFCFVPRGRRLGTFRFLEALSVGCIPVVVSDGWEPPFNELIDWRRAAVFVAERNVLFAPDLLWTLPPTELERMRLHGLRLYRKHFASVERIVDTTLEIIFQRARRHFLSQP